MFKLMERMKAPSIPASLLAVLSDHEDLIFVSLAKQVAVLFFSPVINIFYLLKLVKLMMQASKFSVKMVCSGKSSPRCTCCPTLVLAAS